MRNVKTILATLLVTALIIFSGCSIQENNLPGSDRDEHGCIGSAGYSWSEEQQKCIRPWEENQTTQLANPASEYCVNKKGGILEFKTDKSGAQFGLCILPDGTEIEEWTLFRQSENTNTDSDLQYCKTWHDGCNTCFVTNGVIGGCTLMACSEEMKQEPKCLLFEDEKLIGKILEVNKDTIHVRQGDIAYIFQNNNLDVSLFKVDNVVEIIYNRNDKNDLLLSTINVYVDPNQDALKCTREFDPVCAQTTTDGNGIPVLENFNNPCLAQNAKIIHKGVCGTDSYVLAEPRVCTLEYAPICMSLNGLEKTMSNSCYTDVLEKLYDGECKNERQPSSLDKPKMCTLEYAPVCGTLNGVETTFGNKCEADDNPILYEGECGKEGKDLLENIN